MNIERHQTTREPAIQLAGSFRDQPRLISPAEVRDAALQVKADQSTWRDGPLAVAMMVEILGAKLPPRRIDDNE